MDLRGKPLFLNVQVKELTDLLGNNSLLINELETFSVFKMDGQMQIARPYLIDHVDISHKTKKYYH